MLEQRALMQTWAPLAQKAESQAQCLQKALPKRKTLPTQRARPKLASTLGQQTPHLLREPPQDKHDAT